MENKKIFYAFEPSAQYTLVSLVLWSLFLLGGAYFLKIQEENFLFKIPLILLLGINIYCVFRFYAFKGFLDEQGICRSNIFQKPLFLKHEEIRELETKKSLLRKFFFNQEYFLFHACDEKVYIFPTQNSEKQKQIISNLWKHENYCPS